MTECPMPLGKVIFGHFLEPVTRGRVRVVKRVDVQGAFGSLLRLVAPMMRRQIDQSLVAMGRRCGAGAARGRARVEAADDAGPAA